MNPVVDFTSLSLGSLLTLLVVIAATDVGLNVVLALARGDFRPLYALEYIRTHVLLRIFPIGALLALGNGSTALGLPHIDAFTLAGLASLGLYVVETYASLRRALAGDTVPERETTT